MVPTAQVNVVVGVDIGKVLAGEVYLLRLKGGNFGFQGLNRRLLQTLVLFVEEVMNDYPNLRCVVICNRKFAG